MCHQPSEKVLVKEYNPISLGLWGMMSLEDVTPSIIDVYCPWVSAPQGMALPPECISIYLCSFLQICQSLLSSKFPAHKKVTLLEIACSPTLQWVFWLPWNS